MKLRKSFFALISFFHGWILWAGTGVTPFSIKRATPVSDTEFAIRWIFLPVIISVIFLVNYLLTKPIDKSPWYNNHFKTLFSFSLVYVPVVLLSRSLDWYFIPDLAFGGIYARIPYFLPFELLLLNFIALIFSVLSYVIIGLFQNVLARYRNQYP